MVKSLSLAGLATDSLCAFRASYLSSLHLLLHKMLVAENRK